MKHVFVLLLTVFGALLASSRPSAQCPIPDQLDGGPCCTQAAEFIPPFKKVTQDALDICWRDCGNAFTAPVRAVWTPMNILTPSGPDCGYRRYALAIYSPAAVLLWSGTMRVLYSRTWLETNPAGMPVQVWRFLVNGDLRPTAAAGPIPCPVPPCAPAFGNRVRFTGYLDYARNCAIATNVTQSAWMLTHACDFIDHAPGFPRAGVFHPGMAYTFVGPAAGFVVAPVVATEGTPGSPFEAVRRMLYPPLGTTGPIRCEFEERFAHSLTPTTTFCLCSAGPPLAPQWLFGPLAGGGSCGTTISTPGGPFLPGYLSMGIGSWTIPGVYPGAEDLRWNVGNYDYTEGCTGVLQNEVFFGVTTIGGYPAVQLNTGTPGLPLPPCFIDQSNSITTGGATLMNVPYVSDHIINLNH